MAVHKPNCCYSFRTIISKLFCCQMCKKRPADQLNDLENNNIDIIDEKETLEDNNSTSGIGVLTYNVQVLIGHLSNEKIKHIIDSIISISSKTDVVCLQEVFVEEGRMTLIDSLKNIYPYYIAKSNDDEFLIEDSGLVIFSKYPIKNYKFYDYSELIGVDDLSTKGFVVAEIKIKSKNIKIISTHMQSDAWVEKQFIKTCGDSKIEINTGNEKELLKRIDVRYTQLQQISKVSSSIVLGDFNIKYGTLEYKRIGSVLNKVDAFSDIKDEERPITYMKTINYPDGLKLDYIYVKNNIDVVEKRVYNFLEGGLYPSDHFAVWVKLKI